MKSMNVDFYSTELKVTSTEQSKKQNETSYIMINISYHYIITVYMIWQTSYQFPDMTSLFRK